MLISLILTLLFSVPFGEAIALHEFHVSKCQIEYNEADQAVQVTMHIYLDDLEEALGKRGAEKLFICTEKEAENADEHLIAYLNDRFQLEINDEKATFNFIGKEPSEDLQGAWCYLEFPNISELKNLTVENNLLLEVFDDQKNIVSVLAPGNQQGYFMFQKGSSPERMTF